MNAQEILKQLEENLFDPLDFLWLGYVKIYLLGDS